MDGGQIALICITGSYLLYLIVDTIFDTFELRRMQKKLQSNNDKVEDENEDYYLIITPSMVDPGLWSYVLVLNTDGSYLVHGNLYDSTKFTAYSRAETVIELLHQTKSFCDCEFDIIAVDKRVFGERAKHVI